MSTATADGEEINAVAMVACILVGLLASIGVFAFTYSLGLAILGYVLVTCASYATTWVISSGS